MTLYEIDRRITELVDPETGELLDYEAFQALQMDREEKIEGMALWCKDLTAQAKAIREEVEKLSARARAAARKAEGLKNYIAAALDGEKFSTARCAVSYRRSTSLDVQQADAAAAWLTDNGYRDHVIYGAPTLDKRAVTALLKLGIEVPGVALAEKWSTQVR